MLAISAEETLAGVWAGSDLNLLYDIVLDPLESHVLLVGSSFAGIRLSSAPTPGAKTTILHFTSHDDASAALRLDGTHFLDRPLYVSALHEGK